MSRMLEWRTSGTSAHAQKIGSVRGHSLSHSCPSRAAPFGQHQESWPLAGSNTRKPRFTDFSSVVCSETSLTSLIGSILILLCLQSQSEPQSHWACPEVAILGADQKERGLWRRECLVPRVILSRSILRLVALRTRIARGQESWWWPKGARPLGTRMRESKNLSRITCTHMFRTPLFIPNREKIQFYQLLLISQSYWLMWRTLRNALKTIFSFALILWKSNKLTSVFHASVLLLIMISSLHCQSSCGWIHETIAEWIRRLLRRLKFENKS